MKLDLNVTNLLRRAIALSCIVCTCATAAEAPDSFYDAYAKPGQLVALQDGRKIHLYCAGTGSPTVILTAGFSDWSAQWGKVFAPIAEKTRACSWDRAGYGFSDPSPLPQDVRHTTADLEATLKAANIAGPYVLVGHSLGGFESLLFADRHQDDVAGMILIDPSIPDQARRMRAVAPKYSAVGNAAGKAYIQKKKACAKQVHSGTLTLASADPDNCFSYNSSYSRALQDALREMDRNPARFLTRASLMSQLDHSSVEVINGKRNYGNMPLRVLTAADIGELPSDYDAAALEQAPAFEAEALRAHDALAALSTNGANIVVPGSSHYIQMIKPEIVISTVLQVIDEIRMSAELADKHNRDTMPAR